MNNTARTVGVSSLLLFMGACATVEPRADYSSAVAHVRAATGVRDVYTPERNDIEAAVERLLEGGITADEAVQVCLLNNPRLQAAFLEIGVARADFVQSGLFSNPFVGVSARFPDGGGLANIEASVAHNIAEVWQIPLRKQAARRVLEKTVLRIARDASVLASECGAAYYDAVGAGERLAIARENLTIAQSVLDMAVTRQKAGAANELDVNLSRSLALDAELAVESARLASSDGRRRLARLLGVEANAEELQLVDPLPQAPSDVPDPGALVSAAKDWRLDVRSARQALEEAEWQLKVQRKLVFPTVELGLAFEREERRSEGGRHIAADTARASIANGGLTAPDIEPRSARRAGDGQNTLIGPSLGFELPIFDQNQAQIAKARYVYEQSAKTLEALERAVTQEVRGRVDHAVTAWRVAAMYRDKSVPLAESNLELSRQAYEAGQTSFLSVLEAQRFFLDSRSGYIEAARAAAVAIPELERAVGLPFQILCHEIPPPPAAEANQDGDTERTTP